MPLGPVFRHEMLAAGRKRRYFAVRVLVGLGMLALLAVGYQSVVERAQWQDELTLIDGGNQLSIAGVAQLTATVFTLFAWATLFGVLVITPTIAAGAIASERERRTIEYLFATDLSNAEIVLDKLVARLLTVAALVLATLPVLAIFRLLGGVPGAVLLTHFAVLASTATLTAAIALTLGVWCDRARDAVPRAIGGVFLWLVALPAGSLFSWMAKAHAAGWSLTLDDWVLAPVVRAMSSFHPILMTMAIADFSGGVLGVDLDRVAVLKMVGVQLAVAAALVGLSVAVVRRVHLRAASSPGGREKAPTGAPASRSPYERWPMLWKEMFAASVKKDRRKWPKRIAVALLVIAITTPLTVTLYDALVNSANRGFESYMQMATMMGGACGSVLLLLMGARAAGLVTYERERDTWLSLLTSPLSAGDIVAAKTWGNVYAFRWGLIAVVVAPLLGSVLSPVAALGALGVAATLSCAGWAATAIGLAVSIRTNGSIKAVGLTVLILLGIGVFYSGIAATMAALAGVGQETFAVLVLPPLVPLLLALPQIATFDFPPEEMIVSYFFGLGFYAAVGLVVTVSNVGSFDRLCGRGADGQRPRTIPPSAMPKPAVPAPDAA